MSNDIETLIQLVKDVYPIVDSELTKKLVMLQKVHDRVAQKETLCQNESYFYTMFAVQLFQDQEFYLVDGMERLENAQWPQCVCIYQSREFVIAESNIKTLPKGTLVTHCNDEPVLSLVEKLSYQWGGITGSELAISMNTPLLLLYFEGQRLPKITKINDIELEYTQLKDWSKRVSKYQPKNKKGKKLKVTLYDSGQNATLDVPSFIFKNKWEQELDKLKGCSKLTIDVRGNEGGSRQNAMDLLDKLFGTSHDYPKSKVLQRISQKVIESYKKQAPSANETILEMSKLVGQADYQVIPIVPICTNAFAFEGEIEIKTDMWCQGSTLLFLRNITGNGLNDHMTFNAIEFTLPSGLHVIIPSACQRFGALAKQTES